MIAIEMKTTRTSSRGCAGMVGEARWIRLSTSLIAIVLLHSFSIAQQPAPAPQQTRSVLITGGTVHVGDGKVITEGAVGFRAGKIDHVGYAYSVRASYDTTINASGQHVYPGFIGMNSSLGLVEIESIRATRDHRDVGAMEPELRTIAAFRTDSRLIPTIRSNGVLMVQAVPSGLTISGTSSIVQLDAWDREDALMRTDDGVHLTWPTAYERKGWWADPGETDQKKQDERTARIEEIRAFFTRARAYAENPEPEFRDLRMEAMRGIFNGNKKLYATAEAAREITEVVHFARAAGVAKLVIVGGYDAWRVADLLRDNRIDVVLRRLHSLPLRPEDGVDLPYRLPALLKERGVRFALSYTGEHEASGLRNLPFVAGTAVTYGLAPEDALRAITLDAAAILGISDRCGSLEVGKDATLIVSAGDAFDMRTNDIRHAYIAGRKIILDDHQKELYRMYRQRWQNNR